MNKIIIAVLFFSLFNNGFALDKNHNSSNQSFNKTTNFTPHYSQFNINNISTFIYNNGFADTNPNGNSGLTFPKGSNKSAVFHSGFVWGGKINNEVRVGGTTYNSGLFPGRILSDGTTEDRNNESARVYRVRPDYETAELSSEINDGEGSEAEIRVQYELDWNEWPVENGAPFDDINKDGIYNPEIDIPGVIGADQTLWFVANDLDSNNTKELYGSLPIGIEMQVIIWGYSDRGIFDNMIFKKYKLVNKSETNFEDMYISIWSDPDLGYASDDFVGCDTSLSLVYCYNGEEIDEVYKNIPPSIGFVLLKGPETVNSENLGMTSFHYIHKHGDENFNPPNLGEYKGSLKYYNFMQGKIGNGSSFPVPDIFGGGSTKFPFSGDPINKTGFIEGVVTVPQDRRMAIGSGPFSLTVSGEQEIIFAEVVAQGKDNLNSIQLLKHYVKQIPENLNEINKIEKFHVPIPPIPSFSAGEFTNLNEVLLSLKNNEEIVNFEENGYTFQGYNVYQLDQDFYETRGFIKIATYDVADGITQIYDKVIDTKTGEIILDVVQNGSDSGISNLLKINYDYVTNTSLIKGKEYKYGVSSYYYNPNSGEYPKTVESSTSTASVIFQENMNGIKYNEMLKVEGNFDDVTVEVYVVNPVELTEHSYQVSFSNANNNTLWNLTDLSTNEILLKDQKIVSNKWTFSTYGKRQLQEETSVVNGLLVVVYYNSNPLGIFEEDGIKATKYNGEALSLQNNPVWGYPIGEQNEVSINTSLTGEIGELYIDSKYIRPFDYEIRFTNNENFAIDYWDNNKIISVPFELWNIGKETPNDNSDDIRMIPFVKMQKDTNYWSINSTFEPSNFAFEGYAHPASDWIYWMKPDSLSEGYNSFASICKTSGIGKEYDTSSDISSQGFYVDFQGGFNYVMGNMIIVDYDGDGKAPPPETIIRFCTLEFPSESEVFTFVSEKSNIVNNPDNYTLFQNYPNPFNNSTTIRFYLPKDGLVNLAIYNILGQKVNELINYKMFSGIYEVQVNANNLASGIYFYQLQSGNFIKSRKMLLIK